MTSTDDPCTAEKALMAAILKQALIDLSSPRVERREAAGKFFQNRHIYWQMYCNWLYLDWRVVQRYVLSAHPWLSEVA